MTDLFSWFPAIFPGGGLPAPTAYSFEEFKAFFAAPSVWGIAVVTFIVLGLLILLAMILALLRFLHDRKRSFLPVGSITSHEQILQILNTALEQRSTIEVQFARMEGEPQRPSMRCAPEDVTALSLVVDAFGLGFAEDGWHGRQVVCYFKIILRGQNVYYTFESTVNDLCRAGKERSLLTLKLPEQITNRQKRAFLRVQPQSSYYLGAAIWRDKRMPEDSALADLSKWPRPGLVLLPGRLQQFRINDISAGGMRLALPANTDIADALDFAVSEQIIVLVDLLAPEGPKPRLRFWLRCRVQNVMIDSFTQETQVGVQYLNWAMPKEGGSSSIEWLRLTRDNEVSPLSNWIIQRYLELIRMRDTSAMGKKDDGSAPAPLAG